MEYQTITIKKDNRGIATLTLNRPDKHNAMSSQMMEEITFAANYLNEDQTVRGVVLTGAGKSFCAGADLGWMQDNFQRNRAERIVESEKLAHMLEALNNLDKPLIARVNGQAYAGGIGLISVCDIAIGVLQARFSVTEVRLGLTPANISFYLIGRIGVKNARRTFLNAHFFDGLEACQIGLIDKVVEPNELDDAVENEIQELLSCAPGAVGITKRLIQFVCNNERDATKKYTSELLADCWEGEEAQGGIKAFFDKKPVPWKIE
ncbi:MAG: crotonase/enoyl-CoA hydratase family protein [Acidiferrobacterales bacterium]|nr:crotonase/enoyl-CoA hydratase family protein [Acidiferrobacterales bacterium]